MLERALALALDADLRCTTSPTRRRALVNAIDALDPELNAEGSAPADPRPAIAARLRHVAHELDDTRREELWVIAADVIGRAS